MLFTDLWLERFENKTTDILMSTTFRNILNKKHLNNISTAIFITTYFF